MEQTNFIHRKISFISGSCLILALAILVAFSLFHSGELQKLSRQQTTENLKASAESHLQALAAEQSQVVKAIIDKNLVRARAMAQAALFMRTQSAPGAEARAQINAFLKSSLLEYKDVLGVYMVWNQDALGRDAEFIGDDELASNSVGRFTPYWYREGEGQIGLEVMLEEDLHDTALNDYGIPEVEWYQCAVRQRKACVLDPYLDDVGDNEMLMTSVTYPLLQGGELVGMLGIDISLAGLQPLIESVDSRLVDGEGEVALVSQAGILVARDNGDGLGAPLPAAGQIGRDQVMSWLGSNQPLIQWSDDGEQLRTWSPVRFENAATSWGLVLSAPSKKVLAAAVDLDRKLTQLTSVAFRQEIIAATVIALTALLMVWFTTRRSVKPIRTITERIETIASGEWDLTQRLSLKSNDEIGVLAHRFNQFLEKLHETVSAIEQSVNSGEATSLRASEIAVRSSSGSQQQMLEMEQVATALEQMTATANSVSENAAQAADAAGDAGNAAAEGQRVATDTSLAVQSLVQDVSEAMPIARQLEQESQNIESILKVIQEIAEQTNLLALNAAIEAARAGEQGRGFAVVASEVRALAERTQESVGEIRRLIELLQGGTHNVVQAISSGNDKALTAVSQVQAMDDALKVIVEHIRHITENGTTIASLASEQSSVANEVSHNVSNIREASRSIASEAEASAGLSEELQQLSVEQRQIVTQFKL
ncbi:methyl-accepting chemotaxis protein [Ferrimonas futtsuensis]|uniref:methyl-accepting chemotaxis protein n=1 Tax=Ferrimonas futtsuensis TaxID=364764 RepID=UPI00042893FD|nr:methyl-accepting chemotaxis protein [Ferrimonas futtsuensis]